MTGLQNTKTQLQIVYRSAGVSNSSRGDSFIMICFDKATLISFITWSLSIISFMGECLISIMYLKIHFIESF